MNHIQLAVQRVMRVIPMEVLNLAFAEYEWRQAPRSLMERIVTNVIRSRVLTDANLVGGQYLTVDISRLPYKQTDRGDVIITVPPALLNGASILSVSQVYNVTNMQPYGVLDGGMFGNVISQVGHDRHSGESLGLARRLMDANSTRPHVTNARCELVGENTVMISDTQYVPRAYLLECFVTNDPNLNNISIRSSHAFQELVLRAVKSHIYTKLYVPLERGYLEGGQEITSIKSYVETCADAEELYMEYLTNTWAQVASFSNTELHSRYIRMQVSPGL